MRQASILYPENPQDRRGAGVCADDGGGWPRRLRVSNEAARPGVPEPKRAREAGLPLGEATNLDTDDYATTSERYEQRTDVNNAIIL